MSTRGRLGVTFIALGLAMTTVGGIGLLLSGGAAAGGGKTPPPVAASPTAAPTAAPASSPVSSPAPAPPTPTPVPTPDVEAQIRLFLDQLAGAVREGTVARLEDRLHPAVVNRYGAAACTGNLATRSADPTFTIEVLEIQPPAPWAYETDGLSTPIDGAVAVMARVTTGGRTQERAIHVAILEGTVTWFTDCGTPASASPTP